MANTKEIKKHMKSVQDTQKITNAMYLIASTKAKKAKEELDKTRPYFRALQGEIKRIFRTAGRVESRYFFPPEGDSVISSYACLVITADKGLAGPYNQNVILEAERLLKEHPDTKLFVVGEYGRHYFAHHRIPIEKSFLYTAQNPTLGRAREISAVLLDLFERHEVDKIFIVYTDMKNGLEEQATSTRLLPFHRGQFLSSPRETTEEKELFEFFPSVEAVLDNMIQSYVSGFIYSALVDSFCSEQNARMAAMDAANQNAEKLLSGLSIQYNRVRQAAITQEITEVSAGARAQKKKRQKRREEELRRQAKMQSKEETQENADLRQKEEEVEVK